jgi:predicted dehydrogenase
MEKIPLAIVGCGGMGHRHLYGLNELHRVGLNRFEIIGACDPVRENAESLATIAEEYFGRKPTVVSKIEELAPLGVAAVDITTTPRFHHSLAIQALHHNMHMMIEKPVGLTVRASTMIREAARSQNLVVSVAENYRRDPINRLAKALLDGSVIGEPRFMIHTTIGGGNRMTISVWRHQKDQSGVLLDVGVHFADIMEYFLGPITHVYAQTRLHEPIRHNPVAEGGKASAPNPIYERFQKQMPAQFKATAEDACYATITFANGAVAQYLEEHAGHGKGIWQREIHGSKGSMDLPNDRSGKPIRLHLAGQEEKTIIEDERILDLAPDLRLNKATATLFGGERLWRYDFPFEQIDRKLLAVEYDDFAGAILGEHPAEVDILQGTRSVGVSYAILESGVVGRVVTMDEILNLELEEYQKEINDSLDI